MCGLKTSVLHRHVERAATISLRYQSVMQDRVSPLLVQEWGSFLLRHQPQKVEFGDFTPAISAHSHSPVVMLVSVRVQECEDILRLSCVKACDSA